MYNSVTVSDFAHVLGMLLSSDLNLKNDGYIYIYFWLAVSTDEALRIWWLAHPMLAH